MNNYDKNIELVFSYLHKLVKKKENTADRSKIGYLKDHK